MPARGDQGQVTTALIVAVCICLIGVTFLAVLPLGKATDHRTRIQIAADAAALAGAEGAREAVIGRMRGGFDDVDDLLAVFSCGSGGPQASDYAGRNDANVSSYCYDWRSGRAEATVVSRTVADNGSFPRATAEARLRATWTACRLEGDTPPVRTSRTHTPTPTPGEPTPTPTPTPTPDRQLQLRCGDFAAAATRSGRDNTVRVSTSVGILRTRLRSSLVA